jgi:alkanesulfonate monooxygenase SsuD/methylene tetrahydromethanopterin reductase-like flavin-dependent oxidoreductase (luciferase family)
MWDQIVADGGARRTAGESIVALDEAIRIIRTLWTSPTDVTFDGEHYQLDGTAPGPAPVHDMGIWVGAYQPRLLRLVGRIADAWVPSSPFLPPSRLAAANQLIDDAAVEAGRSPQDVRRVYNIAESDDGFLTGPLATWAEQLAEVALRDGISAYLLYRADSPDVIRRFAAEVVPAVREIVDAERKAQV